MSIDLPDDLRAALEAELQGVSPRLVASAARELSTRYRTHHGRSDGRTLLTPQDAVAYTAYRLPATFAAVAATFVEVRDRRPDLRPDSLLDVGAGPGTAAWAGVQAWPGITRITGIERDAQMQELATSLARFSVSPALRDAAWRTEDLTGSWSCAPADLTVASYVIGELPADARTGLVGKLWACTLDTCVIVEPGTPIGFQLVREAGEELQGMGAQIVAPFPSAWRCLESRDDWTHFSQRVPRTRLHRTTKNAGLSYEDEKFIYVAASRTPGRPIAGRVIRHPQIRSGHIRLAICTADGVQHIVVARSRRDAYRRAKELVWGSAIEPHEASLFGLPS